MRNSMITKEFIGGKSRFEHTICCCRNCEVKNPDEKIPTYYSYQHAYDEGWRFINDTRWKEPGTDGPAAICPDCCAKDDRIS